MAQPISVSPADLLIDQENPRISAPNQGQRKALQAVAKLQGDKLEALARDIVQYGIDPSTLPIVIQAPGETKRYIALEGNRRLAALKALENPDSISGAVEASILKRIRQLSKKYRDNPVDQIQCILVKDREEASHWLRLRHMGLQEGAGIWSWGHHERSRFDERTSPAEPHQQALQFLENAGLLTPEDRAKVPGTTLRRLLSTPEVRNKLGVEIADNRLWLLADDAKVAKALRYVVDDLASKRIHVGDVYTKAQRAKYAKGIPANIVAHPTIPSGQGRPAVGGGGPPKRRPKAAGPGRPRQFLIPRDCVLAITDPRCNYMSSELRRLNVEEFKNAASVLFRVFLEISLDCHIAANGIIIAKDKDKIRPKLTAVANDLENRQKLDKKAARVVRQMCAGQNFLSVDKMQDYVHSQYQFPAPSDLLAYWDTLAPFFTAIWSP